MRKALLGLILPVMMSVSPAVLAQDDDDPRIRLLEAVVNNDAKLVQRLLHTGVDPNVREERRGPAVVMAASEQSFAALEQLAAVAETDLDATNNQGQTALMVVSRLGHLPSVDTLLMRGALVNRQGLSPLHMAASSGHVKVVKKLISARANINARTDDGTTPMMLAARLGQITAYQELLRAGADPTLVNDSNQGALEFLEEKGESERARLLRQYIKKYRAENTVAKN